MDLEGVLVDVEDFEQRLSANGTCNVFAEDPEDFPVFVNVHD